LYKVDKKINKFLSANATDSDVIGVYERETSCKTNLRSVIISIIFMLNNYNFRSLARIASDIPTFIRRYRQTCLYWNRKF